MRTPNFIEGLSIELNEAYNDKDITKILKLAICSATITSAVAILASQEIAKINPPPPKSKFKNGGIVKGNSNGELINLPKGEQIIPNDIARKIAQQNNNKINVKFNINCK